MNYTRIALASVAAFIVYMLLGPLMFGAIPSLKDEFRKYPEIYRSQDGQMSHMPVGIAGMLLSMVASLCYTR